MQFKCFFYNTAAKLWNILKKRKIYIPPSAKLLLPSKCATGGIGSPVTNKDAYGSNCATKAFVQRRESYIMLLNRPVGS